MTVPFALLLLGLPPILPTAAPCIRPTRAGTQVQGETRICPGRYRIADPAERGVIIAASSGTRIDLTGVVLESGDSVPARFTGIGIASRGVDGVVITGGAVRGYRFGVRLEGGRAHRVSGIDASGSRATELRSTPERADSTDRLDLRHREVLDRYGWGVLLVGTTGASVTRVTARGAQNGIGLLEARDSYLADNDISLNSGWGIHLWRSSGNIITRNRADRTRRCQAPPADCGAAAVVLREQSDSNTIVDNDLTGSSIGFLMTGEPAPARPSVGNVVHRNDASHALVCAFSAAFAWNTTFLENRVDSARTGFRLDRLTASLLRANTVIGARDAAITLTHGSDDAIEANLLLGGKVGIRVSAPDSGGPPSRGHRIDDNMVGNVEEGIVLSGTTGSRLRGNVLDEVGDALVLDGPGHGTEVTGNVFLRTSGWFIAAPDLAAGGNYWATPDASAAAARVRGRISVLPWRPASAAGY